MPLDPEVAVPAVPPEVPAVLGCPAPGAPLSAGGASGASKLNDSRPQPAAMPSTQITARSATWRGNRDGARLIFAEDSTFFDDFSCFACRSGAQVLSSPRCLAAHGSVRIRSYASFRPGR